jgi:signal transduction histidine kinase
MEKVAENKTQSPSGPPPLPGSTPDESQAENVITDRPLKYEIIHLEGELRLTLEEIARLQNALADANMKIMAMQSSSPDGVAPYRKEDFIPTILPELKQPIHTIKGYLDLLLNESVGVLGTFQKRFLERIANSVQRMDDLVQSLEVHSGNEEKDPSFFAKQFSPKFVIEETLAFFTDQIRSKSITFHLAFTQEDLEIFGDLENFEKITYILFTNAFDSVKTHGVINVNMSAPDAHRTPELLLEVIATPDEGDAEKYENVALTQFQNLEQTLPGFGCPLKELIEVKKLAEQMGGNLTVESVDRTGSRLSISIPTKP